MTTFQTDLNSKKRGIDSHLSVMGLMLFTYREIEKGA